eukprot:2311646-Amphidinium_carterae.1
MDFRSAAGLGYAFVNLTTHIDAEEAFGKFQGFSDWKAVSQKVCEVAWGQPLQGFEAAAKACDKRSNAQCNLQNHCNVSCRHMWSATATVQSCTKMCRMNLGGCMKRTMIHEGQKLYLYPYETDVQFLNCEGRGTSNCEVVEIGHEADIHKVFKRK